MEVLNRYGMVGARILLVTIFLFASVGKITNFSGTAAFMASVGMLAVILMLVLAIIFEVGGGLSILLGYKARLGAGMLIVFTILATYFFHLDFADPDQKIHFMKNIAMIGGLLSIAVHGAGNVSMDEGIKK